mmetsp:Transcript_24519/g.77392  ORF Transcript_24519/g.77392 Transcript_24519/m.77392 type:complete len:224 (-) Transcript_24519:202-873(-)
MSTSMLSVAVASCSAILAASRVKRIVPVSATRLTAPFTVPMNPSSRALRKPPWPQPPQQGGDGLLNLRQTRGSSDRWTARQKLVLTSRWPWIAQASQWCWVHCPPPAGASMQNLCIFAMCSRAMLRSIHAKKVSTPVTRERKRVMKTTTVEALMPAVAERSPGGMVPAARPRPRVPQRSSMSWEGYFPKKRRKVLRRRQLLPVRVNCPTATSRTVCLLRCRSR